MFELHKDEKVILYVRRHWLFLAIQVTSVLMMFLTPVILVWAAQYFSLVPDVKLFGVSLYSASNILIYLWGLFCWMLLAEKFTDYAIDFWVVTNKRIIESELIKLFDVQLSTLELQDIEDITVRTGGFFANLIGYGKLEVQTAGATNEFYTENIADPAYVQKIMFDAKLAHEQEKMDIEKGEFEQISHRVFKEEKKVEEVPRVSEEQVQQQNFDWAHINQKQTEDRRNVEEVIEEIPDIYKKNVDKALQAGE